MKYNKFIEMLQLGDAIVFINGKEVIRYVCRETFVELDCVAIRGDAKRTYTLLKEEIEQGNTDLDKVLSVRTGNPGKTVLIECYKAVSMRKNSNII